MWHLFHSPSRKDKIFLFYFQEKFLRDEIKRAELEINISYQTGYSHKVFVCNNRKAITLGGGWLGQSNGDSHFLKVTKDCLNGKPQWNIIKSSRDYDPHWFGMRQEENWNKDMKKKKMTAAFLTEKKEIS